MRNLITVAAIMAAILFFWSKPSAESPNVGGQAGEPPAPISPFELMTIKGRQLPVENPAEPF